MVEGGAKQKRKNAKNGKDEKIKRTYKRRKPVGEKTKRIKKDQGEKTKKNKKQKKLNNLFTKLDISSLTSDMINQMNDYLHQEFKLKQEKQKANNESVSEQQQNSFTDFIKNFNYTFTKMDKLNVKK